MTLFNKIAPGLRRLAGAAMGLLVLAGCASTAGPLGLSPEQEKQLGIQEHPKIVAAFGGQIQDQSLQQYAEQLTERLIAASDQPDANIKMTVLDSPVVNAFALPGHVYITRGLLALANSEAELAGVIGHEIGHVYERHTAERVSRSNVTGLGAAILGILSGSQETAQLVGQAAQLYLLSYNRDQEYEADKVGVKLLARAGYDPLAEAYFLNSLGRWGKLQARIAGQTDTTPEFLKTHPNSENRVREAAAEAQVLAQSGLAGNEIGRNSYLNRIDGLLYGEDAYAQGYIQGTTFIHPQIGFAFAVPNGFQLQNTSSAVLARAQSGAQMQFTIGTSEGTARQLIEGPIAQSLKIQFQDVQEGQINNRPAAVGRGRIQTQQSAVDVIAYAIDWQANQKYVFLWVVPPNQTQSLQRAIQASVQSLQRVDASQLNVPPTRVIDVVPVGNNSAQALANQMAFPQYREEHFVIINGLTNQSRLSPNDMVKLIRSKPRN